MKKSILLLFAAALLFSTPAISQITITKSDMPQQGDTVRISLGVNPGIIDLTETGENYNWDYSGLIPFKQRIDTFVNVGEIPGGSWFQFTSDFAVNMSGTFSFPGAGISQPYYYYKSSNSAYKNTGLSFAMDNTPIPILFFNPDIIYQFPLTYSDTDSSNSGTSMNIPGTGYLLVDRHRRNTVDGWGTLTTPYGTFDVIRVKSEVSEYDSVYSESQGSGVGLPYSYTEYKWIGNNQKVPLLTVRELAGESGIVVEYPDSIRGTLGVNEKQSYLSNLAVYPNPVKSKAVLRYNLQHKSSVAVTIVDLSGKTVWQSPAKEMESGFHKTTIDMQQTNLSQGTYLIKITANNNTNTVKFVYLP